MKPVRNLSDYPSFLTISETAEKLKTKLLDPVELTEHVLERIQTTDGRYRAFETVTATYALERAHQAKVQIARGDWSGPLHGVPVALKDIIHTNFAPTRAGSLLHANFQAQSNATVVDRLERAGAVIVGKVKTTEGAWSGYRENDTPPINPWSEDAWAGASSSGSGVATAAGLCHAALASDTGGSIRIPSWCNGVSGFKPSWGAVSRAGIFALAPSLDSIGVIARSARDCGLVFDAIAGPDSADLTARNVEPHPHSGASGIKLGFDPDFCLNGVNAEIENSIEQAMTSFESLGVKRVNIRFPNHPASHQAWNSILLAEVNEVHRETFPSRANAYGPALKGLLEQSAAVTVPRVIEAFQHRDKLRNALNSLFDRVDFLVLPVAPMLVPTLNGWAAQDDTSERFLGLLNLAGLPSLTIPVGSDSRGLPLAMQLVGRMGSDRLILALGDLFQSVTVWHKRTPAC